MKTIRKIQLPRVVAKAKTRAATQRATAVTDQRRAELALRESEARFCALIENATDIISILNADGTIWYTSPATERVTGYAPPELFGKNIVEWIHPDDVAAAMDALAHRLAHPGASPVAMELRMRRRDGAWRTLETIGTNLLDDPAVAGIILNSRDITERKRAEAETQQRNRELATISAIIRATTTSLDVPTILDRALKGALELTGLEGGTLCLIAPEPRALKLAAAVNTSPETIADLTTNVIQIGDCLCGKVADTGEPLILWDNASGSEYATRESTRKEGIRFHAAFPLKSKAHPSACCAFLRATTPSPRNGRSTWCAICAVPSHSPSRTRACFKRLRPKLLNASARKSNSLIKPISLPT